MPRIKLEGATGNPVKLDSTANAIFDFVCPNCGGKFDLPRDPDFVSCPHCGAMMANDHGDGKFKIKRKI